MHDCDRVRRNITAVDLLRKGCNPYDGSPLLTKLRRLCKRDVGSHSWSGEGRPDDNVECCPASPAHTESSESASFSVIVALASQYAEEDDPLGLGFSLE